MCKFSNLCKFKHPTLVNQNKDDSEQKVTNFNYDNYVDYDNIDSDDDSEDEMEKKCDYKFNMAGNLTKHVKSEHSHSCEQCNFKTSNKMHVKACHNKNELYKVKLSKKRKSMEDNPSSRKKTKRNVVSKKVLVMTLKIDNYPKGKTKQNFQITIILNGKTKIKF